MENKDDSELIDYFDKMMDIQGGVACSTVKDGHVLMFSVDALRKLIAQAEEKNSDKVVVFVKRPDFTN